jgi:hypothetical protein
MEIITGVETTGRWNLIPPNGRHISTRFEDDGGTSERVGTWRPAFTNICTAFALAPPASELILSGCFHLNNNCKRSTRDTHGYSIADVVVKQLWTSQQLHNVHLVRAPHANRDVSCWSQDLLRVASAV